MLKNKMILTVFIALVLIFSSINLSAQEVDNLEFPPLNKLEIPKVDKTTLDNGIRLYLVEDKSLPTFEASVRVNCGSYLEPADKVGLASLCGTVMRTGGTKKWTGDDIDEMLEGIGASVETSIGRLSGNASVRVLSEYTDLGLQVLAEILRRPVFDEDKIELAKVQARTAISRRNDEPFPIAIREYIKLIYGSESPYARHAEYASINSITRDDLLNFHKTYYHPENIQIAIWGDFKKKDVIKKVKKYFGDWQKGNIEVPLPPKVDYRFENTVNYIYKQDLPQTYILMGHIGGLVADEDYPARIVMNSVLGGGFGSRLTDNVRSKEGLAYVAFGRYSANIEYPGIFYAYASTKPQTTVKAIKLMLEQIKSMQTDPPTENEMKLGKDGYLNSFVFNFDSKSEVIGRLMNYDFYSLPEDLIFKQKEGVEKVTDNDVIEAARKNLRPDAIKILVLGDAKDFDLPLTELNMGSINEIDITIPSGETAGELSITPENLAKGKKLIDMAVAAHGGLKNFKKINSVSTKATFTIMTPQGEFPIGIESLDVYPDKNRTVVNMMGREMFDIRNGNKGWKADQAGQLVPKTDEDIKKDIQDIARNTICICRMSDNPTYKAVYDGKDVVGDTRVEFVVLLDKNDERVCRIGFNAENNIIVSKSYWGSSPLGDGTIEETYDNFIETEGIKIPFVTHRKLNGQKIGRIEITKFNINPDIPDNAFEKP